VANHPHYSISKTGTLSYVPGGKFIQKTQLVWVVDVERSSTARFTFEGPAYVSAWRPDGDEIVFSSAHEGQGLYRQNVSAGKATAFSVLPQNGPMPGRPTLPF